MSHLRRRNSISSFRLNSCDFCLLSFFTVALEMGSSPTTPVESIRPAELEAARPAAAPPAPPPAAELALASPKLAIPAPSSSASVSFRSKEDKNAAKTVK